MQWFFVWQSRHGYDGSQRRCDLMQWFFVWQWNRGRNRGILVVIWCNDSLCDSVRWPFPCTVTVVIWCNDSLCDSNKIMNKANNRLWFDAMILCVTVYGANWKGGVCFGLDAWLFGWAVAGRVGIITVELWFDAMILCVTVDITTSRRVGRLWFDAMILCVTVSSASTSTGPPLWFDAMILCVTVVRRLRMVATWLWFDAMILCVTVHKPDHSSRC